MLTRRIIPVLLLMNGHIVRAERFSDFKVIGNPFAELARYSEWQADELVYLDISREPGLEAGRTDTRERPASGMVDLLSRIAEVAFMPLAFGGHIRSLEDAATLIRHGADKVVVTSAAGRDPGLIGAIARRFGRQAVVAGIDVRQGAAFIDHGRVKVADDIAAYARALEAAGAGEILVNAIDRDGMAEGYDLAAIAAVAGAVSLPVIACGGAGQPRHMAEALAAGAHAAAAGNLFHFTENAYRRAKRQLREAGLPVRWPYGS
ncbi:MAG: imidazole glycerol phosphate synthase subunit HisF [Thalassobaculales bacterium]